MSARFTLDGSDTLEGELDQLCQQVLRAVQSAVPPHRLDGLLLGGSYGRGEGGVLRHDGCDSPYNDLEFYVFLSGNHFLNRRRYQATLHRLAKNLSRSAGVEIELAVASLRKLERDSISMFSHDLVSGHRWIHGNDHLLIQCGQHRLAEDIPLCEATRLLVNRGSGLLFSKERLLREPFTPEFADFVGRNIAKAKLGLGDVVLTVFQQYHSSARKRHQRLEKLHLAEEPRWFSEVVRLHTEGLEFKLHPERSASSRSVFEPEIDRIAGPAQAVWLWLESRRLGRLFPSVKEYALDEADKCPESSPLKNRLNNALTFGIGPALGRFGGRHPRERLLRAMPLLLWETATIHDTALLRATQRALMSKAAAFQPLAADYERLWSRFN